MSDRVCQPKPRRLQTLRDPQPSRRRLLGLALAAPATAWAQGLGAWPERPITLVVPFAPGGAADITARAVAKALSVSLKQPVNVDNRPGAGSIVATRAVAQAEPDGHTLLLVSNAHAVSAGLYRTLPYDVVNDFAPVSLLGTFDLAIVVDAASPHRSLRELVNHARNVRGGLTIGTIASGSTQHLAAELFKASTRIDAVVVPFKGSPAVLAALRGGDIDVAFDILGPVLPQVQGGSLRALAVTGDRRFAGLPDVPTVQETGVARYSVTSWNALAVPVRTPAAVVQRLHRAVQDALADDAVRRRLLSLGVRAQGSSPAQLRDLLISETQRWGAVIRAAGIEPQ